MFYLHHNLISVIALDKANLESEIMPISSAKTITNTPRIKYKSLIRLLITTMKKNGDVLFPYGHPQLILIVLLNSYIFIYADESNHFAISNSF